jgi:hypothetical protein
MIGRGKRMMADAGLTFTTGDCDAQRKALCSLYENLGFQRKETRKFNTTGFGVIEVALYELKLIETY